MVDFPANHGADDRGACFADRTMTRRRSLWDPKTTVLANASLVPGIGSPRAAGTARTADGGKTDCAA